VARAGDQLLEQGFAKARRRVRVGGAEDRSQVVAVLPGGLSVSQIDRVPEEDAIKVLAPDRAE